MTDQDKSSKLYVVISEDAKTKLEFIKAHIAATELNSATEYAIQQAFESISKRITETGEFFAKKDTDSDTEG